MVSHLSCILFQLPVPTSRKPLLQRLKKRLGSKKAIVALAHRILVIIYHLLKEQQSYRELGPSHADEQAAESSRRWAIRRLEQLGFAVTLTPKDQEPLARIDHEEEVA